MITEDYVSFEIAKLLKENGFTENTIGTYNDDGVFYLYKHEKGYNHNHLHTWYSAPTLQMVMKWLRDVNKLHISVNMGFDVDNPQCFFYVPFVCRFSNEGGEYLEPFEEKEFDSYEQACEAAIKYCLENLI